MASWFKRQTVFVRISWGMYKNNNKLWGFRWYGHDLESCVPEKKALVILILWPICSINTIFAYIWAIYGVNGGKYSSTMEQSWSICGFPEIGVPLKSSILMGFSIIPVIPARSGAEAALDLTKKITFRLCMRRARVCLLCVNLLHCGCPRTWPAGVHSSSHLKSSDFFSTHATSSQLFSSHPIPSHMSPK